MPKCFTLKSGVHGNVGNSNYTFRKNFTESNHKHQIIPAVLARDRLQIIIYFYGSFTCSQTIYSLKSFKGPHPR